MESSFCDCPGKQMDNTRTRFYISPVGEDLEEAASLVSASQKEVGPTHSFTFGELNNKISIFKALVFVHYSVP